MIYNEDPEALKELWSVKEEAYKEVADLPTIKEKIHKRIKLAQKSAKKIREIKKH